jgi:hypothetical protein
MNTYLVTGTRRQVGAIGTPENFQIEKNAPSSRDAYITVTNEAYNGGYEHINVVAIKMRCAECGEAHIAIPAELWLEY